MNRKKLISLSETISAMVLILAIFFYSPLSILCDSVFAESTSGLSIVTSETVWDTGTGATINVTITNMRKEYRYFEEPYFKISNELEGKFDTFYLTEIMDRKSFPIKLEWGQRITVKFELKPAGIAQLKVLPHDTTLKAIVSTTINEISESNKLYISDL